MPLSLHFSMNSRFFFSLLMLIFFTSLKSQQTSFFFVTKVVDGDTFWILNSQKKKEKIRLIGIDAPESRSFGIKIQKEYFGAEAKIYLTQLLQYKKVRLEYDVVRKDRFGRTLAYAYLENGLFLNAHLVQNGYAVAYTIPPNVRFSQLFYQLQRKARNEQKGLWK